MTGANLPLSFLLFRGFEHILNENSIPSCRVVHKNMRYRADEFTILNDRTAAHTLHNAAGFFKKAVIRDTNKEVSRFGAR